MAEHDHHERPERPSDHRRRIFGWISLEQVLQLSVILCALVAAYSNLSADVRKITDQQQRTQTQLDGLAKSVSELVADNRAVTQINAAQQGQIDSLQAARDGDRKILMDINAKVEVLLDRTDPRKTPIAPGRP